ncbi:BRO-N domain-containing protein [Listeria innocua]|uniref:BRO-N domain-containing protein n=1 Tax=Listeria innocua TaxID=1642 RepID=UPI0016283848|nr:Bro-N domain-containing protein [Listeria innocua]MBC1925557.1 Bro-N domain-containing protein [Listeria innocua]
MTESKNTIKLFEEAQVRTIWDEENEKWWLSIIDVVAILTESENPRKYWSVLKTRLKKEGSQLATNCSQLKMPAADGKNYKTDVADTEQILRLIQSIPSKKAEPFKLWLAKVGSERIDETVDPELSIDRAIQNYRRLGYSENWINQRIRSIEVRKGLTDEWDKSGVKRGQEYATLTDLMTETWSGLKTRDYKKHKGLKKENLRDNMTNTELVLNMLAEVAATDISLTEQPKGFDESKDIAHRGASVAKTAREQIEIETGKPAISPLNAQNLRQIQLDLEEKED